MLAGRHWAMLAALAMLVLGCSPSMAEPEPVDVRLAVTAETAPLTHSLAAAVFAGQPLVSVDARASITAQALADLAAGQTDAAFVPMPWPGSESFQQTPIARDGLAVIVHPENPIDNLTLLELQRLFSGRIFAWRDVQSTQTGEVVPAVRETEAAANLIFSERVMQGARFTPNARVLYGPDGVVDFVARTPEAIGFVSAAALTDAVKVVSVEEVAPTPENLTTGAYPLTYVWYAFLPDAPLPQAETLVKFALRPAGQEVVEQAGLGRIN